MSTITKAGRYELLQEIGRGAMGVVYRAQDPVIGRTVAVKTMRLAGHGSGLPQEELLRRFQTEARAAGLLSHPNIVSVYDAGNEGDLFYITMELVEGKSLQELLGPRNAFPVVRVLRLMHQACSALEFAHQHSVVHRDIKPANLILTPDDTLKISDFGTAKILQFGAQQTGQIVGTPSYMSPEQIKGRSVDGRSDIFSLGGVLYELLTGEKAFSGDSVTAVIYKIVSEEPAAPRDLDPSIHAGLSAVVLRALAKSPAARFQSCVEFFDALQNHRDYQPGHASITVPASVGDDQPAEDALSAAGPLGASAPWGTAAPERQGGPVWLALALLLVIAGAGYKVWPPLRELWLRGQPLSASIPAEQAPQENASNSQPEAPIASVPASAPPVPAPPASAAPVPASTASASPAPTSATPAPLAPAAPPQTTPQAPAAAPAVTQVASSPATPAPRLAAVSTTPRPAPRPSPPAISPAASQWRERILQTLGENGNADRIRVVAAGRTLTLVGRLDTAAYRSLFDLLKSTPQGVQIVDHIEFAEAPAESAPSGDTSAEPPAVEP